MEVSLTGSQDVDITLDGKEIHSSGISYFPAGAEIHFSLKADAASDRFRAGLIAADETVVSVNSVNGRINHIFTIKEDGDYTLFIGGLTDNSVHVEGAIIYYD